MKRKNCKLRPVPERVIKALRGGVRLVDGELLQDGDLVWTPSGWQETSLAGVRVGMGLAAYGAYARIIFSEGSEVPSDFD